MKTEAARISSNMAEFIKGVQQIYGFKTMAEASEFVFNDYIELRCSAELNKPEVKKQQIEKKEKKQPVEKVKKVEKKEKKEKVVASPEEREAKLQFIEEDIKSTGMTISAYMKSFMELHGTFVRPSFARNNPVSMRKIEQVVGIIQNGRGF